MKLDVVDASIEYISNGWYRCSVVVSGSISSVRIIGAIGNNDTNTNGEYCYIQDAMFNQGMVSYPYLETTTAPVAGGILEDMPRLDYSNGSCPSLLLEPSRTNLIEYSEYFEAGWTAASASVTSNSEISPEGLQNASTITDLSSSVLQNLLYDSNISSGKTYTYSIFLKKDEDENRFPEFSINMRFGTSVVDCYMQVNTRTGEKLVRISNGTITTDVQDFSDDYWRVLIIATNTDNTEVRASIRPAATTTFGAAENSATGSIVVYGFQIEEGSYPTSYIPTYGVSQTRLQDSATASVTNTTSRTYFLGGKRLADEDVNNSSPIYNATGALRITYWTDNRFRFRFNNDSNYYTLVGDDFKIAVSYNGIDSKVFINGSYWITKTLDLGNLSTIDIVGNESISYNQTLLFPTALSDEACIELTTI